MTYFESCPTLDALKSEYKRLAKLNHPDMGGYTATMQEINNQYEAAFNRLQAQHNATADESHQSTEAANEFIAIINLLLSLDGLSVELCGCWLWIGGNTKAHKDALKAGGCRWASQKKLWYWHPTDRTPKHRRGNYSMGEIRTKYGSQRISKAANDLATA